MNDYSCDTERVFETLKDVAIVHLARQSMPA